jgi:hypothetical protein
MLDCFLYSFTPLISILNASTRLSNFHEAQKKPGKKTPDKLVFNEILRQDGICCGRSGLKEVLAPKTFFPVL